MDHISQADNTPGDGDDFKIRGAASKQKRNPKAPVAKDEQCIICLDHITERAIAVPCNHLAFDFICLVSWLQERSACPLCNAEVAQVQYDFRSPDDYKSYSVPTLDAKNIRAAAVRARNASEEIVPRRQSRTWRTEPAIARSEDLALERRRNIYRNGSFSLHVGANEASQYRDVTPQGFKDSPVLQSRARMFLRRDLQLFSFLGTASAPRAGNLEFLLEYIVAILKKFEVKGADGTAELIVGDYLGSDNAKLLLHELMSWLRSPYTSLHEWDQHVQYTSQQTDRNWNDKNVT